MRRHRGQEPAELGVLAHVALAEKDAAALLRLEARREKDRGRVQHVGAQLIGLVRDRDRVEVDDAVDRLASVLPLHVLANRPDVVAEVLLARRLDTAEDAHGQGSVWAVR